MMKLEQGYKLMKRLGRRLCLGNCSGPACLWWSGLYPTAGHADSVKIQAIIRALAFLTAWSSSPAADIWQKFGTGPVRIKLG